MAKGFTVIELLLVIALIGVIATLTATFGLATYRESIFRNDARLIINLLEQARTKAMAGENTDSYGVQIAPNSITSFQGSSYQPTDPGNQKFSTSLGLQDRDQAVIIFRALNGSLLSPISLTLTNGILNKNITINTEGTIED
jgi:prepilin-type N-terminal cleavage/methylation domain-containing protein